jgi:dethiobiotin synthetase
MSRAVETLRTLSLRLQDAPRAFTTRRVPREELRCLAGGDLRPRSGDLVLAEVTALGHHRRLHLPDGRLRTLFRGDSVVVAYGHRYASSQFEARVPADLGPCHLAAGGGIAARVVERHQRIRRGTTGLRPLGLVTAGPDEPPLNVAAFARPRPRLPAPGETPVVALLGSAMDSGKTTAAAHLVRGLTRLGLRAGYAKITGTGASGDPMLVTDAGAHVVRDFTDVGHASTYGLSPAAVDEVLLSLVGHLRDDGAEVAVLEIADGLLQPETAALLASARFRSLVDGILLATRDAMGALAGAERLRAAGLPLLGLCGALEAAPLEVREARATELPIWGRHDLDDPATASKLVHALRRSA